MRNIYFIASYPRSGNTWVRAFLYTYLKELGEFDTTDQGLKEINRHLPWDITDYAFKPVIDTRPDRLPIERLAAFRPLIHEYISQNFPGTPLVKTHAFRGSFLGHPTINAEVTKGAVYLVRNPLYVAPSLAKHFSVPIDLAIAMMGDVRQVTKPKHNATPEPWSSWSVNIKSWGEPAGQDVLVLRYEDLAQDPEHGFRSIIAHLGRDLVPEAFRAALDRTSLEHLKTLESAGEFKNPSEFSQAFFGGGKASFKDVLSKQQVAALVSQHAVQMKAHGYLTKDTLAYAGLSEKKLIPSSTKRQPAR